MSEAKDSPTEGLAYVFIQFRSGASVSYHQDFSIEVTGRLWPRQMRAAMEMIEIYKQCSKDDGDHYKAEGKARPTWTRT